MAVNIVVKKYCSTISNKNSFKGTKEFYAKQIRDIFSNIECNYSSPHDGGVGVSQSDPSVPVEWRLDLSTEEMNDSFICFLLKEVSALSRIM